MIQIYNANIAYQFAFAFVTGAIVMGVAVGGLMAELVEFFRMRRGE